MEQDNGITAFFKRNKKLLLCILLSFIFLVLSVVFHNLYHYYSYKFGGLDNLSNIFFFISVTVTLYFVFREPLEKWDINPILTLFYYLTPMVIYRFLLFFGLLSPLPDSMHMRENFIFLGVSIPFTIYYLYEGVRQNRPLSRLSLMIGIILGSQILQFGYIFAAGVLSVQILFGLYLQLSIIVTLLFTGSFGVTIRYWEWLLTEPPKSVVRGIFQISRDKVECRHCDRVIPLVGTYTCSKCGFTFKGHYFDWCPYCFSRFGYINCECGLSRKRPLLY